MLILLLVAILFTIAFLLFDRAGTGSLSDRLWTLRRTLLTDSGELNVSIPSSAELRARCTEIAANLLDVRATPEARRDDNWTANLRNLTTELQETNALLDVAHRSERDALETLAFANEAARAAGQPTISVDVRGNAIVVAPPAEPHPGSHGPGAAFGDTEGARSWGAEFIESDTYRDRGEGNFRSGEVEVRNLLTSFDTGNGSNEFVPVGQPFLAPQGIRRMRFFLRDLIPSGPTGLNSIPYIVEHTPATDESGAETVSEASAKPEVTMEFDRVDATVQKIAAWLQITEEAYNDAPTLRAYIDGRLAYMLAFREEAQLLSGNGTSPNIKGILSFSGVQTQAAVAEDLAGTVGLAMAKVENVDGYADGVAINPITFWTGVVERHSSQIDGSATGNGNLPFASPDLPIFGATTIRTRGLATNKALVGCYGMGAQIFDRARPTIKSTDSHASLFISNTLVILAEERLALAVHRPDFFVDTTLSFS